MNAFFIGVAYIHTHMRLAIYRYDRRNVVPGDMQDRQPDTEAAELMMILWDYT